MSEYVKFSDAEKIYGEKNVLHGELELLNIVKRLRNYQHLRKEELVLRIALKKKVEEAGECLKILDKILPHHHMRGLHEHRKIKKELEVDDENLSLEQELEVIRRKLESLG